MTPSGGGVRYRPSRSGPHPFGEEIPNRRPGEKDRGVRTHHRGDQTRSGGPFPVGIRLPDADLQRQPDVPVPSRDEETHRPGPRRGRRGGRSRSGGGGRDRHCGDSPRGPAGRPPCPPLHLRPGQAEGTRSEEPDRGTRRRIGPRGKARRGDRRPDLHRRELRPSGRGGPGGPGGRELVHLHLQLRPGEGRGGVFRSRPAV